MRAREPGRRPIGDGRRLRRELDLRLCLGVYWAKRRCDLRNIVRRGGLHGLREHDELERFRQLDEREQRLDGRGRLDQLGRLRYASDRRVSGVPFSLRNDRLDCDGRG